MTATDTECMTLYLRLSASQLAGLPAVVFELWQRGQQVYYARQNAELCGVRGTPERAPQNPDMQQRNAP